jgi:hypothetical protein
MRQADALAGYALLLIAPTNIVGLKSAGTVEALVPCHKIWVALKL